MSADGSLPETLRVAPQNLEAEQGLLGAILFDNETFNRLGDRLKPHHFYDPVHGRIFEVCSLLISAGRLADGVTLREHFARDGALQEIGGAAYLLTLLENAARMPVHAQEYAQIIYDLSLRRDLISIGEEIAETAKNPPEGDEAEKLIETAETRLFTLAETGAADRGLNPFSTALATSIEMAAAAYENKSDVSGVSSGFVDLDRILGGLHPSDLIILAGRPSMGKSALAVNIAYRVARQIMRAPAPEQAKKKPGVVAFFALEMSAEQVATRLLSDHAGIESERIRRGKIQKHEYEKLKDASAELQALPLHIDETGAI
jgi:replicative DNA helicase